MKWRESYRASSSCSIDPKEIKKYIKQFVTDLFVFQTGKLLILWLYSILNVWVLYYGVQSMWMCMHMCVCLRYGLLSKRATGLQLPWREHWIRNVNWRTDSPSIISYTHTHTHTHTPMCTWDWAREFFPMQPKPLVCLDWTVCGMSGKEVGRKKFRQQGAFQGKVGTVERFKAGNLSEVVLQTQSQEHSRWLSSSKSLRPLRFSLLGNAGENPK